MGRFTRRSIERRRLCRRGWLELSLAPSNKHNVVCGRLTDTEDEAGNEKNSQVDRGSL